MAPRLSVIFLISVCALVFLLVASGLMTSLSYLSIRSSGTIGRALTLPLHTEGRWIMDSNGDTVFLRGVNKNGMADSPLGWWPLPTDPGVWYSLRHYSEDAVRWNIRKIKEMTGANTIKWMEVYDWWMQDPANHTYLMPDSSYLTTEESFQYYRRRVAEIASEEGMYVNLQGFMIYSNTDQDPTPFSTGRTATMITREQFVEFARTIARTLGDLPNVILTPWTEVIDDMSIWFPALQEAITAIREITNMPIIAQWGYGAYADTVNNSTNYDGRMDWIADYPLNGTNLIWSVHMYRAPGGAFGTANYRGHTREDIFRAFQLEKVDWAIQNYPFLLDEIGRNGAREDFDENGTSVGNAYETEAFMNALAIMNDWQVGYIATHWTYSWHTAYALLDSLSVQGWIPPLNDAGAILANAISIGGLG